MYVLKLGFDDLPIFDFLLFFLVLLASAAPTAALATALEGVFLVSAMIAVDVLGNVWIVRVWDC